jgi:hypothetical protein
MILDDPCGSFGNMPLGADKLQVTAPGGNPALLDIDFGQADEIREVVVRMP